MKLTKQRFIYIGVVIAIFIISYSAYAILKKPTYYIPPREITLPGPIDFIKNTVITVPGTHATATLRNGEAAFDLSPVTSEKGYIVLLEDLTTEWRTETRHDFLAVFAVDSGGSGTFYYLMLFNVVGDVLMQKSETYIGDRITISGIHSDETALEQNQNADYVVAVDTLLREKGESYDTPPHIPETRLFAIVNQTLEEIIVSHN
jgi:hypothetical protein